MHLKADFPRALDRLAGDTFRAPVHILEQAAMRTLDSEQIITAVGRRSDNGPIARPRQHGGGLDQQRGRQSRAVRVQDNSGVVAGGKEPVDGREQAIAEIRMPRLDQPDLARQGFAKEARRSRRPESHIASDRGALHCGRARCHLQVRRNVFDEGGVESRCLIKTQGRHEPGLGAPRLGSFRHNGDPATPTMVRVRSHAATPVRADVPSVEVTNYWATQLVQLFGTHPQIV